MRNRQTKRRGLLLAATLGFAVIQLDISVVNVALHGKLVDLGFARCDGELNIIEPLKKQKYV
jgi:hypothetical protein